jgi:beta-glucosidase
MNKKFLLTGIAMMAILSSVNGQMVAQKDKDVAARLLRQMTLQEKIDYIGGQNGMEIRAVPRLGIPVVRMSDGPQGVRGSVKSTLFPCGMALSASWNRALAYQYGVALGQDARARNIDIMLGPGVNIYRSPLCGRNFEYYGEDPYLSSEVACQYIKGVQSQGVMATIKHFCTNNEEYDRHHKSSDVDERTLNEIYLPTFRKAVEEAKVACVMSSYNMLNSVHTSENSYIAIDLLRHKWGFDGIFMSDWDATYSAAGAANGGLDLEMPSGTYMNQKNLLPLVESGVVDERTIDAKCQHILQTISTFGVKDKNNDHTAAVQENPFAAQVALDVAREAITLLQNSEHILPIKKSARVVVLGPNANTVAIGGGSGEVYPFHSVTTEAAMVRMMGKSHCKSLCSEYENIDALGAFYTDDGKPGLKCEFFDNDRLSGAPKVTVIDKKLDFDWSESPAENIPADYFSACWSGVIKPQRSGTYLMQVVGDDGYRLKINGQVLAEDWSDHSATMQRGSIYLEKGKAYPINLSYYDHAGHGVISLKCGFVENNESDIRNSDIVVYCAGFNSNIEGEDHDRTFGLPEDQLKEIRNIAAVNPNLVVVINSGGGVDLSEISKLAKAVLMVWYPGQEGGTAVAEILTGKVNPSGRLPFSIEKRIEDNPTYNSYYPNVYKFDKSPVDRICYQEGVFVGYRGYDKKGVAPLYPFGFGLSYTTFEYKNLTIEKQKAGLVKVSLDVTNTGAADGSEVVQIYVNDVSSSVPRPVNELKEYGKIFLKKGETKTFTATLPKDAFEYYDVVRHDFVLEPGSFKIRVGASSRDIRLEGNVDIE